MSTILVCATQYTEYLIFFCRCRVAWLYRGLPAFSDMTRTQMIWIRWRLAPIEMQASTVALIEKSEFGLPPQEERNEIARKPPGFVAPMIKEAPGEVSMPLTVKVIKP